MDAISGGARRDGVPLVEDAACAAGAAYTGRPAGGLGDAGGFSFHPRKSITTGEGGMVTTNDADLAERADKLRNHGARVSGGAAPRGPAPYLLPDFDLLGFNYRMTDLQAAVGLVQLGKLDALHRRARPLGALVHGAAGRIAAGCACPRCRRATATPGRRSSPWSIENAPRSRDRDPGRPGGEGDRGTPRHACVPSLTAYRERFDTRPEEFPVAMSLHERALALPLHNRMTEDDYAYVVESLKNL